MMIKCPFLSQFSSLRHGFFGPDHESLLDENGFPLPLVKLEQVHGTKVVHVTEPLHKEIEGDGLVTSVPGIVLGMLTADCGPVLFYDPLANVIGACHAGWRGAKAGILQSTLDAMENLGAKRTQIYATLGPTICQEHYEVGPEFPDLIGEEYRAYFYPSPKEGYHYFNLPLYIFNQLRREKLYYVHDVKRDTFTGEFSSRRRFLFQGITKFNFSNLSAIAIV